MTNAQNIFAAELTKQYVALFATPLYAMAAKKFTPEEMAHKMIAGLMDNTADKSGAGVVGTCKVLGIKNTYKAINEFLKG